MANARSSIEIFFSVLGHRDVQRALRDVSTSVTNTGRVITGSAFTGMRALGAATLVTARNAGGLVPAYRAVSGSIKGALGMARGFTVQVVAAGAAAYGLSRAFGSLQESNFALEGSVTTLRALNDELDKANGRAVFAADRNSMRAFGGGEQVGGLVDINAGGARETAEELRFLNKVAYENGLSVNDLTGGYVKLKASIKGTNVSAQDSKQLFQGLAATNTVLAGTPETANRAVIALSQMASKGCHAPGTLIMMADWSEKAVEDVVVGDHLMGGDGKPRTVLKLAHGMQPMYRVTPCSKDNTPFVVNLDHKLRLATAASGEEFTMEVSVYLALPWQIRGELRLINRHAINQHVAFDVEAVGEGEYYGFLISGDHLYLDAQGFEHHNTVMAEELKGQLSEALPGAIGIAARAYGMSVREFNDLVAQGVVDSSTFIKRFGNQLNKEFGAAAEAASRTTRVALGRMKAAIESAKIAIVSGKLDQVFMRMFNSIARLMKNLTDNGAFSRFGEKLSISLDKVVTRFEHAVDGGYDFERVLNSVAKGFDFLIRTGEGAFDLARGAMVAFRSMVADLEYMGIRLPSIADGLRSIGDGAKEFSRITNDGYFGDNNFINFVATAYTALREFVALIVGGSKDSAVSAVDTMSQAFARAAHFMGQLAFALKAFRTGKVDDGMDSLGEGLLVDLIVARDRILEIRRLMTGLQGLVTGEEGAPEGATGGMKRAYGYRDALGRLFTGQSNVDSTNPDAPYDAKNLNMLFQVRDILGDVFSWIIDNKAAIAAAFQGALDAVNGIADTIKLITDALSSVGLDVNVGYMLGALFVLGKIPGVMFLIKNGASGLMGAFTLLQNNVFGRNGLINALMQTRLGTFALIGALAALTAYIYDRYGNQISGGFDRVRSWFGDEEAGKRYENMARLDQLADSLKQAGNKQYLELIEQGLNPIDAARKIQEQVDGREIMGKSAAEMARAAQESARQTQVANDNTAFLGGGANEVGPTGINNTVVIEIPGAGSFTVNPDGTVVDNLDPNVARARSGRPSSWAGVGR